MSMIESIVRPFATPLVIATQRIAVLTTTVPPETAILTWGDAGSVDAGTAVPAATQDTADPAVPPTGGGTGFKIVDCDERLNESSRETESVRIENPDDPTQYVIVQRIKKINFGTKPAAGQPTSYVDASGFVHDPDFGSNPATDPCEHIFNLNPPTS